jgi:hypothetical protein
MYVAAFCPNEGGRCRRGFPRVSCDWEVCLCISGPLGWVAGFLGIQPALPSPCSQGLHHLTCVHATHTCFLAEARPAGTAEMSGSSLWILPEGGSH